MTAQEGLEQCRRNMEARERELQGLMHRLSEDALVKRRAGDILTARSKLLERKRVQKRLERLRHGLDLVDTQLDAIKTSELDKEIMLTLRASTSAMKKAGITLGVQEVEAVMTELDEQMREVQDVTTALSNPLMANAQALGGAGVTLEDAELDAELDLLDAMGGDLATAATVSTRVSHANDKGRAAVQVTVPTLSQGMSQGMSHPTSIVLAQNGGGGGGLVLDPESTD